ncbi:MAG TPA: ankyrin repeat domain-containing protein [Gammaproteobacteria bacterium]|nr:ankyrin repeat domain-containing protein [Gammaproteobacteria bacterium]
MNIITKELKYLLLWIIAGCLLVPPVFWWLGSQGVLTVPGMEFVTLRATYLHIVASLREPLWLVAVSLPYLIFIAVRMLRGSLASTGSTELGLAVSRGESALVKQLIEQGLDLNQGNAAGETPLHLAAMRGDMGMTWMLLEGGADFNTTDQAVGYSPLQIAALQGHSEICEALIRYGASVDALTSRHETALHLAARAGHGAVVSVLLKYRANTAIRNNAGQTARQLAEQHGHAELVSLMEQHASNEWPYLRLSNG